ncbi:sulfatase family protein [Blastopirellula marina]|uniref:Arylsulfatase A n=1 Tax=Blastopirellula marina DSM 3645 TaxID=314230 RepID=A4A218_9BACT|nr:sulfatase [Blastopirellula marina]EAQ77180.1 arylsulfatase A [Blastopirellula marina DSM 3645]
MISQPTLGSRSRNIVFPALLVAGAFACFCDAAQSADAKPPNIVLFFVDNLGTGDIGCYGSTLHRTPHIDRLAAEGAKFTSFYVASGVCTPSRAALMTGCYPLRVDMHKSGEGVAVLRPLDTKGLNPKETTMAEVLHSVGYATGIFGKWHLGDQPEFLPTQQGFDTFFGIPYSDDMTKDLRPQLWPELPLMRDEQVIEAPVDRDLLVKRCTEEAIAFIEQNQERPFFVYIPHTMPGSTKRPFSSPAFQGKSKNGPYGDSVEELDWSTGQVMETLKRLDLDEQTLVIWTSDNGAPHRNPPQGSNLPYQGDGYNTSEGAMRMPCVMRWPGKISAGQINDALCTTMDLLPTFGKLAGATMSKTEIDGHEISRILLGESDTASPWDDKGFAFYYMDQLQAIRAGRWKLYLPLDPKTGLRLPPAASKEGNVALYDVRNDVHEDQEVSAEHPDVVAHLTDLAQQIRREIGDVRQVGTGRREAGKVKDPQPLVLDKSVP